MPSVDPRHLLQFHEIIRTRSFTRAATTLGLTQPALTRNMKLMEGRLGFELMVRSRQGIMPTPLGERILEEAAAVVLAERRISALTDKLRRGYEAELRVGCTPTLSLHATGRRASAGRHWSSAGQPVTCGGMDRQVSNPSCWPFCGAFAPVTQSDRRNLRQTNQKRMNEKGGHMGRPELI